MTKKMKKNNKLGKTDEELINSMIEYQEESSILGNTFFIGFLLFGIIIITFSIIYYFLKFPNTFILGILAFLISLIISLLYFMCQRRKKCKIRMIVDLKSYKKA